MDKESDSYKLPAKQVMTSLMSDVNRLRKENDSLNAKLKELLVDLEQVKLQLVLFQRARPSKE